MSIKILSRLTAVAATVALAAVIGFAQPASAGHRSHGHGHYVGSHNHGHFGRHHHRGHRRHHYRRHYRGHYTYGPRYYNPALPLAYFFGAMTHHGYHH